MYHARSRVLPGRINGRLAGSDDAERGNPGKNSAVVSVGGGGVECTRAIFFATKFNPAGDAYDLEREISVGKWCFRRFPSTGFSSLFCFLKR